MFRRIWLASLLKKYLDNLIQAKIECFAQNKIYPEFQKQKDLYFEHRWREILQDARINSLEILLHNNLKIKLYKDSLLSKYIYFNTFENDEIQFVSKFLNEGDVFVDIGANIGLFSLYASPFVGENGKVISFEPASLTYQRLQENISLNSLTNIQTENCALSDNNGTTELQLASDGHDAWNSIAKPSQGNVLSTEKIQTQTLDSFIQSLENPHAISLMKIDVEGWEIPVLKGGKEFLVHKNAPSLLIEFTEQNANNAGYSCEDLYNLLISYGYILYFYNASQNELIQEDLRDEYPYVNLIATKDLESVYNRIK